MTTHFTCLRSTLQVVQSSTPELIPSAYLNGNEKWLPWNRPFLSHGLSWSFERKKWRYWRVTIEESPPFPMLPFPHYLLGMNTSPQSTVWIEESLSAQRSHRCRLLTHHHKYCCVFPSLSLGWNPGWSEGRHTLHTDIHLLPCKVLQSLSMTYSNFLLLTVTGSGQWSCLCMDGDAINNREGERMRNIFCVWGEKLVGVEKFCPAENSHI